MRKVFYLLFILCLVLTGCAATSDSEEVVDEKQDKEVIQKDEKDITSSTNYYEPGTYKVGVDIPAGEYEVIGSSYIGITDDSTGYIIDNDSSTKVNYIRVFDGETLTVVDSFDVECFIIPESEADGIDLPEYTEGRYKVGKDIPAGNYQLISENGNGYYAISKYPIGNTFGESNIKENEIFDDSTYVTVNEGDYLYLDAFTKLIP